MLLSVYVNTKAEAKVERQLITSQNSAHQICSFADATPGMEYTSPNWGGKPAICLSLMLLDWFLFHSIKNSCLSIQYNQDIWLTKSFLFWCFFWLYLQTKELSQTLSRLPLAFYFFRVVCKESMACIFLLKSNSRVCHALLQLQGNSVIMTSVSLVTV